jgi:hypothetical protein
MYETQLKQTDFNGCEGGYCYYDWEGLKKAWS